jgi:hypothetical protein
MAILVRHQGSDWNSDLYDQVFNKVVPDPSNPPAGMLSHGAGQGPEGWEVIEVWESQDVFDSWMRDQVGPAAQEIEGPPFDTVTLEAHNTLIP